uniref:Uncharacterized protein n=1 Tax=Oryza barthii TaxID=65489 RepID=A0A0D3G1P8_9ORYZ
MSWPVRRSPPAGLPAPLACPTSSLDGGLPLRLWPLQRRARAVVEQWRRRVASCQASPSCRPSSAANALVLSLLAPPKATARRRPP